MAMGIVTCMVVVTLILLITEKVRVDIATIGIMVVLVVTGILTPWEAVAGCANVLFMVITGCLPIRDA